MVFEKVKFVCIRVLFLPYAKIVSRYVELYVQIWTEKEPNNLIYK